MKFGLQKVVAVATILALSFYTFISVLKDADSAYELLQAPKDRSPHLSGAVVTEPSVAEVDQERALRSDWKRKQKMWRGAVTLKILDETEDIWFRQSPEEYASSMEEHERRRRKLDANAVELQRNMEQFSVCGRKTKAGTSSNDLLLLQGDGPFGRTGNNIIEFLHALQFARDNDTTLGLMHDSWALKTILQMWMYVEDDDWQAKFEEAFCVKIFHSKDEVKGYNLLFPEWDDRRATHLLTKFLFMYSSESPLQDYVGHQAQFLQTLFRHYNNGGGKTTSGEPVQNMCSGLDAVFGRHYQDTIYTVIHQRSLEGAPGKRMMHKMSERSGCHPTGALDMRPDYIKSILEPLGMLKYPIVLITDGQDPSVYERLNADSDISKVLRVVPEDASWIGGDITLAVTSNVFIGNPVSTFSGIIAKSRLALGFGHNYLFRAQDGEGNWRTVCGDTCVFDKRIMGATS